MSEFIISKLEFLQYKPALDLAFDTFMLFEAPEYLQSGIDSFKSFVYGDLIKQMYDDGKFIMWQCTCNGKIVGVLAIRDTTHISLLFVHKDFHRQGIGRMLFNNAVNYLNSTIKPEFMTVNSSPYGLPFYRAVGFKETDMEQIDDGIRYTPMKANLL